MWAPRRKKGCPAPRKASLAPPRPAEIEKTRGAQQGKADCRLNRLCRGWAKPVPGIFAGTGIHAFFFGTSTCIGISDTSTGIPGREKQRKLLFLCINVREFSPCAFHLKSESDSLTFIYKKQFVYPLSPARNSCICIWIPCTCTCSKGKCKNSCPRKSSWYWFRSTPKIMPTQLG